ncbi:MAG: protein-disulfide reductase DsbD [Candidatus Riflebacteria bacterium]|nr:protein-disulfide reductase DsbD [Candidatus Riflebacteria bacterium]
MKKIFAFVFLTAFFFVPVLNAQNPGFFFECSPAVQIKEKVFISTFSLIIQDGYFLYSDKINLSGKNTHITRQIWPRAHNIPNQRTKANVSVYPEGIYKISLLFDIPPEATSPVLNFSFHACSTQTAFLPQKAEIPLVIKRSPTIQNASRGVDFFEIMQNHGSAWAMIAAFLAGLLISFTPCVYPMIPITLSVIGGRGSNTSYLRGATLSATYVAGLSLIYSILGLLVAYFGAHIRVFLNGSIFQLLVSIFFALMAMSMFDFFVIETPNFIKNRLKIEKTHGYLGVFSMGMLSGLIASPCVAAPLAGILAYIASTGSLFLGFFLLMAFSWGMGALLILVGTFSSVLNSLPKAGEWTINIKEFYAFLLWGVSIYFAQSILGSELNNIRTAIFLGALATFAGYFRKKASQNSKNPLTAFTDYFRRDSQQNRTSATVSGFFEVLLFLAAIYFLLTAAWTFLNRSERYAKPLILAANPAPRESITWLSDFTTALQQAKIRNLPILIDFRSDWCSICLDMEKNVFPNPQVQESMKAFILLKIDLTNNTPQNVELSKNYGIIGIPTFVFLNSAGQELTNLRITGGIEAPELISTMQSALRN